MVLFFAVPARIVNISTDVSVNEGSNVSLMCLAIGRPEPSILWKFRSSKGDGKGKGNLLYVAVLFTENIV